MTRQKQVVREVFYVNPSGKDQNRAETVKPNPAWATLLVVLVLACAFASVLMLAVPSGSIAARSVYRGF
jgi:hypothetical protein